MGRMDGKVAIITGGARGQGASHARRFVAEGARVVVGDVLDDDGAALADALGNSARFSHLDVTSEDSWRATVELTSTEFGAPTVLVNNAGIVRHGQLLDVELAEFQRILDVNLIGTWLGIKSVAPSMIAAGGGSIINIASTGALVGYTNVGAYVASKWGVRGLTKTAALELGQRGIRVNSVHPGVIQTPMLSYDPTDPALWASQPVPRVGQPEEITQLVVFLASDESSFSTGSEFVADGGQTAGSAAPSTKAK
jgi:3alpha(or 20beta)-hydroxysteroid dehydrogenase